MGVAKCLLSVLYMSLIRTQSGRQLIQKNMTGQRVDLCLFTAYECKSNFVPAVVSALSQLMAVFLALICFIRFYANALLGKLNWYKNKEPTFTFPTIQIYLVV